MLKIQYYLGFFTWILAGFILGSLLGKFAFSASSGSITLSGSIPTATHIVITATTGYNSLSLTTGATNQVVASVREINNTSAGYNVTLSSANAGLFKNGSVGQIAYTARYNSVNVNLTTLPQTITTQGSQSSIVNVVKDFDISFTATAEDTVMSGNYSDTLTFTITSN